MEEFNIGIIGGCMTCQPSLKLSQLFFRQFANKVSEQDGIKCYVNLRYYNEYFRIPELAEQLISKSKPDIIILQVRPAPFIMRSEFLIQDYKGGFLINPLIRSQKNIEQIESILATKDAVTVRVNQIKQKMKRLFLLGVMKYNIRLGNLFRLERIATRSLISIIDRLVSICSENQIQLFVIGTISSYNIPSDKCLSGMNDSLKKFLSAKNVMYFDIYSALHKDKNLYFSEDRFHLNEIGHKLVADYLYEGFKYQPGPVFQL